MDNNSEILKPTISSEPSTNCYSTYISGGRTGDLIHVLAVIHARWLNGHGKGILYLTELFGGDKFTLGVDKTYNEIKNILKKQEYIEDVLLYNNSIPNNFNNFNNFINLNLWRNYFTVLKSPWPLMLSSVYNLDMTQSSSSWIKLDDSYNKYPSLQDTVVLHHSLERYNNTFPWEKIISQNKCIFITCNKKEYDGFQWKSKVDVMVANDLDDFASMIYSSKCFVGNMSMPCALAWALGKPLLCALGNADEQPFYMCKYISWFKDKNTFFLDNISNILNVDFII